SPDVAVARTLANSKKPVTSSAYSPDEAGVEAENNIAKDSIDENIRQEQRAARLSPTNIICIYKYVIIIIIV
ncbi:hypothetical protein WA026_022661, partial [Henosepilachna vigintioctopunctata]